MAGLSGEQCMMIAGSMLFIAGAWAFLGIVTAEALYPGYSTHRTR
jgi:hypothetical protein